MRRAGVGPELQIEPARAWRGACDGVVLTTFSPDETRTAELVRELRSTGTLRPLLTPLQESDGGPRRARDALLMLGELDLEALVQIALDTLLSDPAKDRASTFQTIRVVGGDEAWATSE